VIMPTIEFIQHYFEGSTQRGVSIMKQTQCVLMSLLDQTNFWHNYDRTENVMRLICTDM